MDIRSLSWRRLSLLVGIGLLGLTLQARGALHGGAVSGGGRPMPMPAPQMPMPAMGAPVTPELSCTFASRAATYQFTVSAPGAAVDPRQGDALLTRIDAQTGQITVIRSFFASRRYEVLASGELAYTYFESVRRSGFRLHIRDHKASRHSAIGVLPFEGSTEAFLYEPALRMRGALRGGCTRR